ncbi:helix-turn-helix transcriptional regulator [Wansuia hejianensis]|uniref:WYL domain-containing protein n=1 Tax=Wansuia hejianensis TaxID=2763667 RepID=A0A926INV4_9FIRM|nr:WYL domain-containing protein [Wansuia hejianensis]MBC8591058.1 WYL domain-containing protein [Wansuia hejianensis]
MSRLSNALYMYILLQSRPLLQVKEIAEILEVSPRMVKQYKKDLEMAGIYIGSQKGRYGGYYLQDRINLKGLGITKEELDALKMANEIIRSGNHIFALDFEILANKILNAEKDFENIDYFNKNRLKPIHLKKKEEEIWKLISKAIAKKRKIKISYKSLNPSIDKRQSIHRIVHVYGTFEHDGAIYLYGYCELRRGIRYFKISRIESINILDERFKVNREYDIKQILGKSFGIVDDDEFYLKLKISYPMSQLVKEKQVTVNQRIREIDEDTIIYEANIKGYVEVKSWVLSMGSHVEVLEPNKLRQDIIKEFRKLQKLYE